MGRATRPAWGLGVGHLACSPRVHRELDHPIIPRAGEQCEIPILRGDDCERESLVPLHCAEVGRGLVACPRDGNAAFSPRPLKTRTSMSRMSIVAPKPRTPRSGCIRTAPSTNAYYDSAHDEFVGLLFTIAIFFFCQ